MPGEEERPILDARIRVPDGGAAFRRSVVTWDVHDNQRRDWWGNPVVPSWYTESSLVLDLDGIPQPRIARTQPTEMAVTIGADGFSYTRADDAVAGFTVGSGL